AVRGLSRRDDCAAAAARILGGRRADHGRRTSGGRVDVHRAVGGEVSPEDFPPRFSRVPRQRDDGAGMILSAGVGFAPALVAVGVWSLRLVRRDRLYSGYGVVALLSLGAIGVVTSTTPARAALATIAAGSWMLALSALAGVFAGALLFIYLLSQLT